MKACWGTILFDQEKLELIAWNSGKYEPLLTCKMSEEQLIKFLDIPKDVPNISVYGQCWTRTFKEMAKVSTFYGHERKNEFIKATMAHRILPVLESKQNLLETKIFFFYRSKISQLNFAMLIKILDIFYDIFCYKVVLWCKLQVLKCGYSIRIFNLGLEIDCKHFQEKRVKIMVLIHF